MVLSELALNTDALAARKNWLQEKSQVVGPDNPWVVNYANPTIVSLTHQLAFAQSHKSILHDVKVLEALQTKQPG